MADILSNHGAIKALEGIESNIASIEIIESDGTSIATATVSTADFAVSGSLYHLSNTAAIDFTIAAADVGKIAAIAVLHSSTAEMLRINLDATVTLTTEGTATFAIGAFTVKLN